MIERIALQRRQLPTRLGAGRARASRWQRWVESLLARYGRASGAPGLSATFRRSPAAAPLTLLWQRVDAAVALRQMFQVELRRSTSARYESRHFHRHAATLVERLVRSLPSALAAGSVIVRAPAPMRPQLAMAWERTWRTLEGRAVSRHVRHAEAIRTLVTQETLRSERRRARSVISTDETLTRLRRRAERQLPDAAGLPPLGSVLARSAPVASTELGREQTAPPNPAPPFARHAAQPAVAPTPPLLNLDRITEQVIDRLDRRIVAQRERMGRV